MPSCRYHFFSRLLVSFAFCSLTEPPPRVFDDITLLSANTFNANVMLLVVASDPKLASLQNDDTRALVGGTAFAHNTTTASYIHICTQARKK